MLKPTENCNPDTVQFIQLNKLIPSVHFTKQFGSFFPTSYAIIAPTTGGYFTRVSNQKLCKCTPANENKRIQKRVLHFKETGGWGAQRKVDSRNLSPSPFVLIIVLLLCGNSEFVSSLDEDIGTLPCVTTLVHGEHTKTTQALTSLPAVSAPSPRLRCCPVLWNANV